MIPETQHRRRPRSRGIGGTARRLGPGLAGVIAGALVGATLGWSPAAALVPGAGEGAGYDGTAGSLHVTVDDDSVRVTGGGFMADSIVLVRVGDLSTSVRADEFGRVDAVLSGDGREATAVGTASDGTSQSLTPVVGSDDGRMTATVAGAGLGGLPLLVSRRRRARGPAGQPAIE